MTRRRGRRDNGLDAVDYAPVGDLDPRVGEHLLDLLAARGIAAYLQPSMDVNPITRDTRVPARPTDRLYADRTHLDTARDHLRQLTEDEGRGEGSGAPAAPAGSAGSVGPTEPAGPADRSPDEPDGEESRESSPPSTSPPRQEPSPRYVDATFEGIVARYEQPVDTTAAPWPEAEDLDGSEQPQEDHPPSTSPAPVDARGVTEPTLLDALDTFGTDVPDRDPEPEERFVPPTPPPLPRLSRQAVLGGVAILVGLALLLTPVGGPLGRDQAVLLGFAALLGGATALILRLRPGAGPDDRHPDDGAQV